MGGILADEYRSTPSRWDSRIAADGPTLIDESNNAAGCHKISMAVAAVRHARLLGYVGLTAGSCGNYGLALALAARNGGMAATICIPRRYSNPQIEAIGDAGSEVVRHGETYEDAVSRSRRLADDRGWADCNPDGPFEATLLGGLASRIEQRLLALTQPPDVFWLPLGNGTTTLATLTALERLGSTSRVVAVTSRGNNSVLSSWRHGRHVPLAPGELHESRANEPLCNWNAAHGPQLLATPSDRLSVIGVPDRDLIRAAASLRRLQRVQYTPSGSAGYAGYADSSAGTDHHAVLLTARDRTATTT